MLDGSGAYPMAKRQRLSRVWKTDGICSDEAIVSMSPMSEADFGDLRNDVSSKPSSVAQVVLGHFHDGHLAQGSVDAVSAETAGNQELPDGMAPGA